MSKPEKRRLVRLEMRLDLIERLILEFLVTPVGGTFEVAELVEKLKRLRCEIEADKASI